MQADFLVATLKKLRKLGIHTAIDTSGYAPAPIFNKVVSITDLILFDLKIVENKKHKTYTGIDNGLILKNLQHLLESETAMRIRIPLVNTITADNKNLERIRDLLAGRENVEIDLLSYHDLGKGKRDQIGMQSPAIKLSAPSPERIDEIRRIFDPDKFTINLGG